ncbi:SPOR domain-containing protein [Candidatus Omnitrophota bacterium]
MERKEKQVQYDFFEDAPGQRQVRAKRNLADLFYFTVNPEHIVIALVCLIMAVIVSFSFGVEKGKKIIVRQSEPFSKELSSTTTHVVEETVSQPKVQQKPIETKTTSLPTKEIVPKQEANYKNFTIQVASFKKEAHAEQEGKRLQQYGQDVLILQKGKYVIVCIGNFDTKKEAEGVIGSVRKQYNDCYIRRL